LVSLTFRRVEVNLDAEIRHHSYITHTLSTPQKIIKEYSHHLYEKTQVSVNGEKLHIKSNEYFQDIRDSLAVGVANAKGKFPHHY
jgi:hypothetical protein